MMMRAQSDTVSIASNPNQHKAHFIAFASSSRLWHTDTIVVARKGALTLISKCSTKQCIKVRVVAVGADLAVGEGEEEEQRGGGKARARARGLLAMQKAL
jgi:hypothetical protein